MDFSKLDDAAQWSRLESELAGLDIGVLGECTHVWRLHSDLGYLTRQGTGCFRSSKMRREVDAKVLLPCHYWTAFHVDELIDIARISDKFWRSENNACPDAFRPSESRCGVYHRGN